MWVTVRAALCALGYESRKEDVQPALRWPMLPTNDSVASIIGWPVGPKPLDETGSCWDSFMNSEKIPEPGHCNPVGTTGKDVFRSCSACLPDLDDLEVWCQPPAVLSESTLPSPSFFSSSQIGSEACCPDCSACLPDQDHFQPSLPQLVIVCKRLLSDRPLIHTAEVPVSSIPHNGTTTVPWSDCCLGPGWWYCWISALQPLFQCTLKLLFSWRRKYAENWSSFSSDGCGYTAFPQLKVRQAHYLAAGLAWRE